MLRNRTVISAAALAVAAAGTMLGAATSAQAAPGNCTISTPTASTVAGTCTSGTGHHRIHVILNALDPRNPQRIILGDWAPVGQKSVVTLPYSVSYVANVWIDLSDS